VAQVVGDPRGELHDAMQVLARHRLSGQQPTQAA
jgi:hypothetical protein